MVATLGTQAAPGTIDSILKEFYLGPLQKQLNNEVLCLELFQKMVVDWNGRRVVVPLHISRNTGVAYAAEGAALPAAGQQGYEDLSISARFMYGRFQVSGPAMAAAAKGGKNSFIAALEGEMSGLKDDIRDRANIACFAGGRSKGYINEHKIGANLTTAAAAQNGAGNVNAGENVFEYAGDFTPFLNVVAGEANSATWVRIHLFRVDNGAEIVPSGAAPALFVSAIDQANQTITIANVSSAGGGGQSLNTTVALAGDGILVALHATQYVGTVANIGTVAAFADEPEGIYGNLSDPAWHGATVGGGAAGASGGIDRTLAANAILRCTTVKTCNRAGDHSRIDLALSHIQAVFDEVLLESDMEPDCMIINPIARQRYISLLQGVINSQADTVTKGDGGFKSGNLGYGGVKFKVSRHCGRSMIIGLKMDKWKMVELQKGEFADLDGAVLARVTGQDNWEGFYRWYYNQVCQRPNANFILLGFNIVN